MSFLGLPQVVPVRKIYPVDSTTSTSSLKMNDERTCVQHSAQRNQQCNAKQLQHGQIVMQSE